jgi:hypothetical protein
MFTHIYITLHHHRYLLYYQIFLILIERVRYGVAPPALPAIAGIEGVGSIAAVGSGVKNLKPNDRVIPVGPWFGIKL